MTDSPLTVGEVGEYIRQLTNYDPILGDLWVSGEVSNARLSRNGHLYFSLSDDLGTLRCVIFKQQRVRQRSTPRNGEQVSIHGAFDFYVRSGDLQFITDLVQPAGIGLAALELERLRVRLDAEGLFDPSRKRELPTAPQILGVVTSPAGSVWHDIQQVVERRFPLTRLLLAPAAVQGADSVESLIAAIDALVGDGRAEVIIIARGGGSAEDLAAFNDERLVRALFACPIPVVSAIGHETDFTLADFVADVRAATPSVAAELCVPSVADYRQELNAIRERLSVARLFAFAAARQSVSQSVRRLRTVHPAPVVLRHRSELPRSVTRLNLAVSSSLRDRTGVVERTNAMLVALNPWAVLDRGYAVLHDSETRLSISRAASIRPGSRFEARFNDGIVGGTVSWVRSETARNRGTGGHD